MEGISEAALLALLCGERLDGLQVEVVVQVQVVEVLPVDEEVEHVVALAADLQSGLDPVQLRGLEELGRAEASEEVLLLEALGGALVKLVEHVALEELLVAHSDLSSGRGGRMFRKGEEREEDKGGEGGQGKREVGGEEKEERTGGEGKREGGEGRRPDKRGQGGEGTGQTLTGYPAGQCSLNQLLTSGTSRARRM